MSLIAASVIGGSAAFVILGLCICRRCMKKPNFEITVPTIDKKLSYKNTKNGRRLDETDVNKNQNFNTDSGLGGSNTSHSLHSNHDSKSSSEMQESCEKFFHPYTTEGSVINSGNYQEVNLQYSSDEEEEQSFIEKKPMLCSEIGERTKLETTSDDCVISPKNKIESQSVRSGRNGTEISSHNYEHYNNNFVKNISEELTVDSYCHAAIGSDGTLSLSSSMHSGPTIDSYCKTADTST